MRHLFTTLGARRALGCWMLTSGALFAADGVSAESPDDGDAGSDAALGHFLDLADDNGYTVVDPVCSSSPAVGTDLSYTCYALTTAGEPFIARTTLGSSDVVEFRILAAPDESDVQRVDPDAAPFDALAYFNTLFSGDPAHIASLKSVTAPDSPAQAYAVYQFQFADALVETGGAAEPSHVYLGSRGVTVCVEAESCVDVTNLEVIDGRLTDFAVGGYEIAARLGRPGQAVSVGAATVQAKATYRPVTGGGSMRIYVDMSSSEPAVFELSNAVYLDADGNQTPDRKSVV